MTSARRAEPAGRWRQLAILAATLLLALVPWFSAASVAPLIAAEWQASPLETALLTVAVQLGFVVGALVVALHRGRRRGSRAQADRRWGVAGGDRQCGVRDLRRRPGHRPPAARPQRGRHRRRLPGRHEGARRLVPWRTRPGGRRPDRRNHLRLGAAVPAPSGRRRRRPGLANGRAGRHHPVPRRRPCSPGGACGRAR